jgi:hypothetical protein
MTKSKNKGRRKGAPPAELVGRVTLKGGALHAARIAFWTHTVQHFVKAGVNAGRELKPRKATEARSAAWLRVARKIETMNVLGGNGTPTKRVTLEGEDLRQVRWAALRYTAQGVATGRRFDDRGRTGEDAHKMLAALFATRPTRKGRRS